MQIKNLEDLRKIKAEARWAVEGISARRKRNQGRVRALAKACADLFLTTDAAKVDEVA